MGQVASFPLSPGTGACHRAYRRGRTLAKSLEEMELAVRGRGYLTDVLPKLGDWLSHLVAGLTPAAWKPASKTYHSYCRSMSARNASVLRTFIWRKEGPGHALVRGFRQSQRLSAAWQAGQRLPAAMPPIRVSRGRGCAVGHGRIEERR